MSSPFIFAAIISIESFNLAYHPTDSAEGTVLTLTVLRAPDMCVYLHAQI